MALFVYGALLREKGLEILCSDFVESATPFRKAAGVYEYLSQDVLPPLEPKLPPERPPEATPSMASIMRLVCLAEAQILQWLLFLFLQFPILSLWLSFHLQTVGNHPSSCSTRVHPH